jgi:nucleoside-diphosphate-sugar epimerase
MSLYLVTGGAGFIGSHIVDELIRRGEQVRVLDNFFSGKRENLPVHDRLEIIEGDIRDRAVVARAMQNVDYVLHQAALPSVQRSVIDPQATNDVNVNGTLNLLTAARDEKVKRCVFASSSSVYGNSPTLPKHEDMPTQPLSPYAVSKLAGEAYCLAFHEVYGLPTVALRYFNVFGPKQDPNSEYSAVIPRFITAHLNGKAPTIYGDGLQSRDFTFVANVVTANLLACEREAAIGQVMNVACGEQYTLLDLQRALIDLIGSKVAPHFMPPRTGEVKHSMAAIERAAQLLDYQPNVNWQAGLKRTTDWYSEQARAV